MSTWRGTCHLTQASRGKISFSARSILSTSSRMIRMDCWFFAGWAEGAIPSRAPRIW